MAIKLIDNKKPPVILFSKKAKRKIDYVVKTVPTEVGWLGSVEKSVDDKTGIETYKITDIFVPKQEVAAATCEIKPEGRHELLQMLLQKYEGEEGIKFAESLLFWGHSHVNMGVSPSGQDESMVMDFKTREYLIRGIFNKQGSVNLDLFKFKENIQWTELSPTYEDQSVTKEEKEELDLAIKNNLKPIYGGSSISTRTYTSYVDDYYKDLYNLDSVPCSNGKYTYKYNPQTKKYEKTYIKGNDLKSTTPTVVENDGSLEELEENKLLDGLGEDKNKPLPKSSIEDKINNTFK
jgi:hypothetical protein